MDGVIVGVCTDPPKDQVVVDLVDVDAVPGTIKILNSHLNAARQYGVDEATGLVNITVKRVGGSNMPLKVSYRTRFVTSSQFVGAIACTGAGTTACDYVPVNGTLEWADGDASDRVVRVLIILDSLLETFEAFEFVVEGLVEDSVQYCGGYEPYYSLDGAVEIGRQFTSLHCGVAIFDYVTVTIRDSLTTGYFELESRTWPFVVPDDVASGDSRLFLDVTHTKHTQILTFEALRMF